MKCAHVEIDGRLAFVEIAGEGPPVLCVHSAGQAGVQWREVLRDLPAHGYQPVVVDLPGHGRSDGAGGGPVSDLSVYRDWCFQLLRELGLERPYLVGCSIGGKIVLDMAATADRAALRGVVAMAADAFNRRLSPRQLELSLEDAAAPSRADRTYYGTLAVCGRAVEPQRAAAIAEMHRREDPVVTTSDLLGWTRHDLRDRLAAIGCPVRLVVGEDDFWVEADDVAWASQQIGSCQLEVLARIGHYPMEEIEGFPQLLVSWLTELADHGEHRPRG